MKNVFRAKGWIIPIFLFAWIATGETYAQSEIGAAPNPFQNRGQNLDGVIEESLPPPVKGAPVAIETPRPPLDPRIIRATKRDCRRLNVAHAPRADVAYKPGVDVRGNPVNSADAHGGRYDHIAPNVIEFSLQYNPLQNTGLAATAFGETSVSVGEIRYDINSGKLTLNGEPLTDDVAAEMETACRVAGFIN